MLFIPVRAALSALCKYLATTENHVHRNIKETNAAGGGVGKYFSPEAEVQTNVFRVFLLAIHSHIYSFVSRFLFLQTNATSYSFYTSVSVHCNGERRKTRKKTIPPAPPYGLRNLKSENSQDHAQKP